jgi:hypothetical protein
MSKIEAPAEPLTTRSTVGAEAPRDLTIPLPGSMFWNPPAPPLAPQKEGLVFHDTQEEGEDGDEHEDKVSYRGDDDVVVV